MKPASKHLVVLGLASVFAAAVWCASLAAPGQALASVAGCSQNGGPVKMAGCGQFLCGLESSANLLSQGALSSARYNDLAKSAYDLSIGEVPFDASIEAALSWKNFDDIFLVHGRHKVSTRLRNSVLNL